MKVKIVIGDKSIELEGTNAEISAVLDAYWFPSQEPQVAGKTEQGTQSPGARAPKNKRRTRTPLDPGKTGTISKLQSYDPMPLVNKIKAQPDFAKLEKGILHKTDRWKLCQLVLAVSEAELTSGQICKVLTQLKVKVTLPALSTALSNNNSCLQHDKAIKKGSIPLYQLTGKAKSDFNEFRKSLSDT